VSAAWYGNVDAVGELLRRGVSPDARDRHGTTPLYVAAMQGHVAAMRALVRAGADPDLLSEGEGEGAPLCGVALWGYVGRIRELLRLGANPDVREEDGVTPLLYAAQLGRERAVRVLLDAGANPNATDDYGATPLMRASSRGSVACVQILLAAGADPQRRDSRGQTALDYALEWSDKDVAADLRDRVREFAERGSTIRTRRTPRADGTELITVSARRRGSGFGSERQTGHREIVRLLRRRAHKTRHRPRREAKPQR
jgi:ankyrin repeat protein